MKVTAFVVLAFGCLGIALKAQDIGDRVRQMEAASDSLGAHQLLERAVREQPNNVAIASLNAEFLDGHGDQDARQAYETLLKLLPASDKERRASVLRLKY